MNRRQFIGIGIDMVAGFAATLVLAEPARGKQVLATKDAEGRYQVSFYDPAFDDMDPDFTEFNAMSLAERREFCRQFLPREELYIIDESQLGRK